jgi:hypothetical protein
MTPAEMDRVFGGARLQIATGGHVEVFREAVQSGQERRYTKRFLATASGDFRPWTEREWRILERLSRHPGTPVAKALEFLPADAGGPARLQSRDAGATVDQWATLVPLRRGDMALRSVFEDCANWWSLARHCLIALDALHALGFVHLDLKADNVCIPWAPAGAGRPSPGQPLAPRFRGLALIDVAFSLLPEVELVAPLPLLRQPAYEYQSPRLLHALEEGRRGHLAPTRALDWRCDFFSLAAMLWLYLPDLNEASGPDWTAERHALANEFVRQLLDVHGAAPTGQWPHRELIATATLRLREPDLAASLQAGCTFDPERTAPLAAEPTAPTRMAEARREPVVDPVASAPAPLPESRREPTVGPSASAPAPLTEAPPEPEAAPAAADAAEASTRKRTPVPAGVWATRIAVVLGLAATAWWVTIDRAPDFSLPPPFEVAGRSPPASAASPRSLPASAVSPPSRAALPFPAASPADTSASASARRPPAGPPAGASAPPPSRPEGALAQGDELDAVAAEWLRTRLPRVAESAERQVARVLAAAAASSELRRRGNVRAVAQAMRAAATRPAFPVTVRGDEARTLNDAALVAYGRSDDVADALRLQTKAFGANPLDTEVVGNLAFLRLKERPPQAEAARQLALHALTLNDPRFPSGRIGDWTTFAIASALSGHDVDARNAWFASMALTDDLQRQCSAAVSAQTAYGERLRPSVQAMLQRARSSAAYGRCDGPEPTPPSRAKPTQRARRTLPVK